MAEMAPEQQKYPSLDPYNSSNGNSEAAASQMENAKNTVVNSEYSNYPPAAQACNHLTSPQTDAQSAMSSISNSQTVQNLQNGPVADKAREEAKQTQNEFGNLASSRKTPDQQTATGQNLTHYHSFFYTLLSWENPRATAISYASVVLTILAWRYLPIVRYALRGTWVVLGITAAAEIAGKLVLNQGFTSKLRPRKYYTIPRETLESALGDVEELINFFVIEVQRILFAENVYATVGAFLTTLITYFLIKITPAWGLALLFTTLAYFVPLGYISNKELIDSHIDNASNIISEQSQQVRDLASQHTSKALEASQSTFKDYSVKAQEALGQAKVKAGEYTVKAQDAAVQGKQTAVDKGVVSQETADKAHESVGGATQKTEEQLSSAPSAPSIEPVGPDTVQAEEATAEPVLQ